MSQSTRPTRPPLPKLIRLSADLVGQMDPFIPPEGMVLAWWNFNITGSALNKMPVVVKVRLPNPIARVAAPNHQVPVLHPDMTYRLLVQQVTNDVTREGRECLDKFLFKITPAPDLEPEATLSFLAFEKSEDVWFRGKVRPMAVVHFVGEFKRGVLYFAPYGSECTPVVESTSTEVLQEVPAVLQLMSEGDALMNATTKYVVGRDGAELEAGNGVVDLYDHRTDRDNQVGLVRRSRRTVGRRSFEFMEVRDWEGDPNEVKYILLDEGLLTVPEAVQILAARAST